MRDIVADKGADMFPFGLEETAAARFPVVRRHIERIPSCREILAVQDILEDAYHQAILELNKSSRMAKRGGKSFKPASPIQGATVHGKRDDIKSDENHFAHSQQLHNEQIKLQDVDKRGPVEAALSACESPIRQTVEYIRKRTVQVDWDSQSKFVHQAPHHSVRAYYSLEKTSPKLNAMQHAPVKSVTAAYFQQKTVPNPYPACKSELLMHMKVSPRYRRSHRILCGE
jgi:hypothetical protein